MKISYRALAKRATWTTGAFVVGQVIRLATNVVLTRLLAPELFGTMVIVNSLKAGVELMSDVGIGQSIIINKNADDPDFYNTAWTLQLIRGLVLWIVASAVSVPMAFIYGVPTLLLVIPVASLVLVISGFNSISPALLQRKLQIGKLSIFEIIVTLIFAIAQIALAYLNPTIWALVFGLLVGSSATMIGSYFLIPELKHKFKISKSYFWQIIGFGKWIFISSAIFFFSMNFDRLYLAGVIPLALLGVYGIARSISELLSMLVARLGNIIIFPLIASYSNMARSDLYEQLASIRLRFLLFAALVFSVFAATADFAIRLIFDQRYHAAGWMLPVLIIGAWFSIMCNLNESVLLGLSKPQYSSIANGLKFAWLLIGLPLSFVKYGAVGAIIVVAISDLWRYTPIFIGQVRERFSFGKQDVLTTIIVLSLIGILEWLRWVLGLGTSFEDMPIASLI